MKNNWNIGVVNANTDYPIIVNFETIELIDSDLPTKKIALEICKEYRSVDRTNGVKNKYIVWESE